VNRRAKLSLVPSRDITKKQAPGFEGMASATESVQAQSKAPPRPPLRPAVVEADVPPNRAESSGAKEKVASMPSVPWTSGRQLVKIVVVVVATALSLYLLKRRFF